MKTKNKLAGILIVCIIILLCYFGFPEVLKDFIFRINVSEVVVYIVCGAIIVTGIVKGIRKSNKK